MPTFTPPDRFGPRARFADPDRARNSMRALLALLLALALLASLLWLLFFRPHGLATTELVGDRGPGCAELVVLRDRSGSMDAYIGEQTTAVEQLIAWSSKNLRPDDRIAVIDWADRAQVSLGSTPLHPNLVPAQVDSSLIGGGTLLAPALTEVQNLGHSQCATHLLVISDGGIADTHAAATLARSLTRDRVKTVTLLNPVGPVIPAEWSGVFPETRVEAITIDDPDVIALAIGRAVSSITGQQLVQT